MKRYFRACMMALILTLIPSAALAADITGLLKDKTTGEPLIDAAVRLLAAKDSAFVKGVTSNAKGIFKLADVKPGKYIVQCTYIGYNDENRSVKVETTAVRLGTIEMGESSELLKEVSVVGVKTPIKVMEDTVEYNTSSYKTQPNAVVEDLLKRLPGVEVDTDGKITANGKSVSKILVDGKEFFSDDPKVASKNLPADMFEKLQVVDRKSDMARLTGVDDGEDETVINLTFKKGRNNGWFGTAEAGYGTDSHYSAGFNVNRFWDGNQITFLGNFNDLNQTGFTDSNGSRFMRFGGSNGLTTSKALGINFNVGNKEILRVGGDLLYSYTRTQTKSHRDRQNIFTDSSTYSKIDKLATDRGNNFRGDFRVLWKPDSFNVLEVRPNFSANFNRSTDYNQTLYGYEPEITPANIISNNVSTGNSKGWSYEFGTRVIYSHNFKQRRGRSFSLSGGITTSNVIERDLSTNDFYKYLLSADRDNVEESAELLQQYKDTHRWNNNFNGRFTWTEPIGNVANGNFLTFSYRASYRWNNSDKRVYDVPDSLVRMLETDFPAFGDLGLGIEPNEKASNVYENISTNQNFRVGYKKTTKAVNFEVGMGATQQTSRSIYTLGTKQDQERSVWNYAPFLRYRYKFGKNTSLQANYRGQSNQPSLSQLQPVRDESNPTNIIVGNPDLLPSFDHNMEVRYQDFNMESQRSMMFMGNFSFTQNAVTSNVVYSADGKRTTFYENINGNWNGRLMNMFSMPFSNKKWSFSNFTHLSANRNVGLNNSQRNVSFSASVGVNPGLTFRPDHFELELRPTYRFQYARNSVQSTANKNVHAYGARTNVMYYTDWGFSVQTDLNYSETSGYSAGYDTKIWRWNANISQQFLRDRSLTVSVRAYDLLNQNSSISRNMTANYIEDAWNMTLGRYVLCTLSYRFNSFGKGKEPQVGNMMEGPGGHGGPGRPAGPGGPGGGRRW